MGFKYLHSYKMYLRKCKRTNVWEINLCFCFIDFSHRSSISEIN